MGTALSHLCEDVSGNNVDQTKKTDSFLLTTKSDAVRTKELTLTEETMLTGSAHSS